MLSPFFFLGKSVSALERVFCHAENNSLRKLTFTQLAASIKIICKKAALTFCRAAVSQKKGGGVGFEMFKAGMTESIAGQIVGYVAQTAIMTAANMSSNTKSKDQFTFEYSYGLDSRWRG